MANLNTHAAPRSGIADLMRELKELRQEVAGLRSSQQTLGRATVTGTLAIANGGALRIDGSLYVPAGSINNDALADPVGGGWVNLSATNFALTTAGSNVIASTVTVPEGFTSCIVSLTGRVYAVNPTAVDDYVYARPEVAGVTGTALPVHARPAGTAGDGAVNVAPLSTTLTGLSGGTTFAVRLWAASALAGWAADVDNTAELTGTLTWFA